MTRGTTKEMTVSENRTDSLRCPRWLARLGLVAATLAAPALQASPLTGPGTYVAGLADYQFVPCTTYTCDPAGALLSDTASGGNGVASASTTFAGGYANGAEYRGKASLQGELSMPELHALARGTHRYGSHDGYSTEGGYDFSATGVAAAVQRYTYTGSTDATYSFTFTIDGLLNWGSAIATPLVNVFGFAGLYDGHSIYGLEDPLGQLLSDGAWGNLQFSELGNFLGSFTITADLHPGQEFLMSASLSAFVGRAGTEPSSGEANAWNTMTGAVTQGDARLLRASLTGSANTVPEPGTLVLLVAGLALASWPRRMRHF